MSLGSAFLAGAFVFWENHDLKKNVVFGSAFVARALVLEKCDLTEAVVFGSTFLVGAFVF